jgi:hypothetical protein
MNDLRLIGRAAIGVALLALLAGMLALHALRSDRHARSLHALARVDRTPPSGVTLAGSDGHAVHAKMD